MPTCQKQQILFQILCRQFQSEDHTCRYILPLPTHTRGKEKQITQINLPKAFKKPTKNKSVSKTYQRVSAASRSNTQCYRNYQDGSSWLSNLPSI